MTDTGDTFPIKQSPRRPPLSARQAEDDTLDEMLESGVIEPSDSQWASPVCLVKKKEGTFRFCVDYRRVNSVSRRDAFPIPDEHDIDTGDTFPIKQYNLVVHHFLHVKQKTTSWMKCLNQE